MTYRELTDYWLADNGAPYRRLEYQINKAGHGLLIGLTLAAACQLLHVRHLLGLSWLPATPLVLTTLAVVVYWTADFWAPFADHRHAPEHPVTHYAAKLAAGALAPALLLGLVKPLILLVWLVLYLPVLLLKL